LVIVPKLILKQYITQVAPYPGKQYPPGLKATKLFQTGRTRWTIA
jgi:hypothetical protein